MYIDTHAHLNFKTFDNNLDEVVEKAIKKGVTKIIIPGAKIDSSKKAVEIAGKYDCCFAAVGIHPHHVEDFVEKGKAEIEQVLSALIKNDKVTAIGETGLDYHRYNGYPEITPEIKNAQKELFLLQLSLASEFRLPVIIHCRNAFEDLLHLLEVFLKSHNIRGVFHCFSGNWDQLKKVLGMGFYIGIDGNITYQENQSLRDIVKHTPLMRLLFETDSPYLTPLPHRGQRNEPGNIPLVAKCVSGIKKIPQEKLEEITSQNALRLFSL